MREQQGTATAAQPITQPERGHIMAAKKPRASAGNGLTKVRTTFNPAVVIEVGSAELLDLDRQKLIDRREGDKGWRDGKAETTESGIITEGETGNGLADDETKEPGE